MTVSSRRILGFHPALVSSLFFPLFLFSIWWSCGLARSLFGAHFLAQLLHLRLFISFSPQHLSVQSIIWCSTEQSVSSLLLIWLDRHTTPDVFVHHTWYWVSFVDFAAFFAYLNLEMKVIHSPLNLISDLPTLLHYLVVPFLDSWILLLKTWKKGEQILNYFLHLGVGNQWPSCSSIIDAPVWISLKNPLTYIILDFSHVGVQQLMP